MQQQDLLAVGGIAIASAAAIAMGFLACLSFSAWLQKRALVWVGQRFLDIYVEGRVFLACFIGGLFGWGASRMFFAFDAGVLACTASLLAAWPFLHLWVREQSSDKQLSVKTGAILSATSGIVAMAIIELVFLALKTFGTVGYLTTLAMLAYNQ